MKPFDLQKALSGAKLVTRDGREVTEFIHDPCPNGSAYNYLAYIGNTTYGYSENGKFYVDGSYDHELDLFLAEPSAPLPPARTMWVNVYRLEVGRPFHTIDEDLFPTKEDAMKSVEDDPYYYATLPIEIPVK